MEYAKIIALFSGKRGRSDQKVIWCPLDDLEQAIRDLKDQRRFQEITLTIQEFPDEVDQDTLSRYTRRGYYNDIPREVFERHLASAFLGRSYDVQTAQRIFLLAWDQHQFSGFPEVAQYYRTLAELTSGKAK